jgi:HAD superfamily hydrolase (TIGR01509 family)
MVSRVVSMDWLFFDCFNTLLDDFDANGDESGLGTLPALAVSLGACASRQQFVAAYHALRHSPDTEDRESSLEARLTSVVSALATVPRNELEGVVKLLLERWHAEYPACLRVTPGTNEMLAYWHGKRRMGVVSNFFVAGLPQLFLERFGLVKYFEFVIDSASLGYRKPGRRIFEAALARANTTAAHVTFIGDRLDLDIAPAHRLGMRVVHLDRSSSRPGPALRDDRFPAISHHDEFRLSTLQG